MQSTLLENDDAVRQLLMSKIKEMILAEEGTSDDESEEEETTRRSGEHNFNEKAGKALAENIAAQKAEKAEKVGKCAATIERICLCLRFFVSCLCLVLLILISRSFGFCKLHCGAIWLRAYEHARG